MRTPIFQLDAFTLRRFAGNPAAVVMERLEAGTGEDHVELDPRVAVEERQDASAGDEARDVVADPQLEAGRFERGDQRWRPLRIDGDGHVDIGGQPRRSRHSRSKGRATDWA